jgi:hypothetical protein
MFLPPLKVPVNADNVGYFLDFITHIVMRQKNCIAPLVDLNGLFKLSHD